jgi:hypothetical protein
MVNPSHPYRKMPYLLLLQGSARAIRASNPDTATDLSVSSVSPHFEYFSNRKWINSTEVSGSDFRRRSGKLGSSKK